MALELLVDAYAPKGRSTSKACRSCTSGLPKGREDNNHRAKEGAFQLQAGGSRADRDRSPLSRRPAVTREAVPVSMDPVRKPQVTRPQHVAASVQRPPTCVDRRVTTAAARWEDRIHAAKGTGLRNLPLLGFAPNQISDGTLTQCAFEPTTGCRCSPWTSEPAPGELQWLQHSPPVDRLIGDSRRVQSLVAATSP